MLLPGIGKERRETKRKEGNKVRVKNKNHIKSTSASTLTRHITQEHIKGAGAGGGGFASEEGAILKL